MEGWKVERGLVTWKERVYVPVDVTLQGSIIEIHHSWGHPGIHKTTELITRNYWWPGLQKTYKNIYRVVVTTRYGLLHYDYLICRTGPFIFLSTYLI